MKANKEELDELRTSAMEARDEADRLWRLYHRAELTNNLSGIKRTPDPETTESGKRMRRMADRKRKADGYFMWIMRFGVAKPELIIEASEKMLLESFWEGLDEWKCYDCKHPEALGVWIIPVFLWAGVTDQESLNHYN